MERKFTFQSLVSILALSFLFAMLMPAHVFAKRNYTSYITPFTNNQNYKFHVFGGRLAQGLARSLKIGFANDKTIDVIDGSGSNIGLSRQRSKNLDRHISARLGTPIHVAVIMIGPSDTRTVYNNRRKHPVGSELVEWKQIYESRIVALTRKLQAKNIAVYWVGLPIMREKAFNEKLQLLNDTFREMAYRTNIKFIDTWNGFTDQYGQYTPFAADVDGQIKKLRDKDGVHFTPEGYEKLAHYVQREISRDLKIARDERNIPLAGDSDEQRNTMLQTRDRKKSNGSPVRKQVASFKTKIQPSAKNQLTEQNKRAIANSFGNIMAVDINSGLTLLLSVSSLNSLGSVNRKNSQSLLPLVKRPYYKVLVRGEVLPSKSGRADDFNWVK